MNRTLGSIVLAVLAALALFGVRYYFRVQHERQVVDDFISARLQKVTVPLDCPPFGRMSVIFDTEDCKTEETTEESMTQIVKNWDTLWSAAYPAIDQKVKEYNARDHLTEKLDIIVVLPEASLSDEAKWSIETESVAGVFTAEFTGRKVTSSSADF